MKDLTLKELQEAPPVVMYVYMAAVSKIPIGSQILNEAMEKHPEYFPEETELGLKWKAVPEYVQQNYHKELFNLYEEIEKDNPVQEKGLMFFAQNPGAMEKSMAFHKDTRGRYLVKAKEIHQKYLSSYGIPFNNNLI